MSDSTGDEAVMQASPTPPARTSDAVKAEVSVLDLSNENVRTSKMNVLLGGDIVVTRRERVENVLRRDLPRYAAKDGWQAPAGVFLSILLALVSADFKKSLGISVDGWRMLFAVLTFVSFVLLMRGLLGLRRRLSVTELAAAIVDGEDASSSQRGNDR